MLKPENFKLSPEVRERARDQTLPRREWRVLFAFSKGDEGKAIEELEIPQNELAAILHNLSHVGLLERLPQNGSHPVSADAGAGAGTEAGSAEGAPPPPPAGLKPPPPPSQEEQEAAAAQEAAEEAKAETPAPGIGSNGHGVLLKPVIDFIQNSAGSGTLGQLTVYRVFLKIPPHLLKEAQIQSVKFVNDDFRIESPELQQAIRNAVKRTLNKEVPEELLPG
jgi:hypothetical protein